MYSGRPEISDVSDEPLFSNYLLIVVSNALL
jgi:hypothetical protein